MSDFRPGIFWTWQDEQVEDEAVLENSVRDMSDHGFGRILVQPRGCRYAVGDPSFIAAVGRACAAAHHNDLELWLHLDPRSMGRQLVEASGECAEYLIVAGTNDEHKRLPITERPLDVVRPIAADGSFEIRIDYSRTRNYHVHSDGAILFRPVRLETCLAFKRTPAGPVEAASMVDVSDSAHLFTNEIVPYVEVFGVLPELAGEEGWEVLALVAFESNYPDFAGAATRKELKSVLRSYAALEEKPDGLWWDEPGYCTGFDRAFRADRGRIPWSGAIADRHRELTGRVAREDLPYLLLRTDDGLWGERRRDYYRTLETAVLGAQEELSAEARRLLGDDCRMGVHQTWHQNADDVINGCGDWWRGAKVLGAGFSDVGDAERTSDPRQMAEVRAMSSLAVSLARRTETGEAYCNLWGVDYGNGAGEPSGEIVDWWVDLQATMGCNWLAHTYGPTGYFERPPVWGPGYPDHPTWDRMTAATGRLSRALELAEGRLPQADIALVYPLGSFYRLGSDFANNLASDAHLLIDALLQRGYELDIVSPDALKEMSEGAYRGILCLHPFGAAPAHVEELAKWRDAGTALVVAGLGPVPGEGYANAAAWHRLAGVDLKDGRLEELLERDLEPTSADLLGSAGLEPSWQIPEGALASRTPLADGGLLLRLCPAEFGRPFRGQLKTGGLSLQVDRCDGLLCLRLTADGEVREAIAPPGVEWRLEAARHTA